MATPSKTKQARLTGAQDLLAYFSLIPIYNKFVGQYPLPDRAAGLDPSLFPYVSDFPGNNTMNDEDSLLELIRNPQIHENGPRIEKFDADTLRDAYSLKEGPIPGFDKSILGTDDGGLSPSGGFAVSNYRDVHGTDGDTGERKHKKKKKKRKHSHEHDEDGHSHGDHKKKKKKRKKERDPHRSEIEVVE